MTKVITTSHPGDSPPACGEHTGSVHLWLSLAACVDYGIGSQSAATGQRHKQPAKGRRAVTATTSPTVLIQNTGSVGRPTWRRRDCLPFERVDIREVAVKLLARCDPVWERPLWQDPRSLREGRLAVALSRTSLPLPLPHARWPRAGCAPRGRESLPRSGPGPARALPGPYGHCRNAPQQRSLVSCLCRGNRRLSARCGPALPPAYFTPRQRASTRVRTLPH